MTITRHKTIIHILLLKSMFESIVVDYWLTGIIRCNNRTVTIRKVIVIFIGFNYSNKQRCAIASFRSKLRLNSILRCFHIGFSYLISYDLILYKRNYL